MDTRESTKQQPKTVLGNEGRKWRASAADCPPQRKPKGNPKEDCQHRKATLLQLVFLESRLLRGRHFASFSDRQTHKKASNELHQVSHSFGA